VLHVLAEQEKNRVEHYVPLHPSVVSAIIEVLAHDFGENDEAKPFFIFNSFEKWLERQKIPLPGCVIQRRHIYGSVTSASLLSNLEIL